MKKLLLACLLVVSYHFTHAQAKTEIYTSANGALNGYDVIAFHTDSAAIKGSKEFSYEWKNTLWYFVNEQHLNQFKSNPEKYVPEYGGWCAYGTSRGYKAPTEASTFTFIHGKLYFNYNQSVKNTWIKNTDRYIEKADVNWIIIKDKN